MGFDEPHEDAHDGSKAAGLQRLLGMLDSGELRV